MCYLFKKSRMKSFAGYKIVLVDNQTGRVYSPATGVEYKAGPVPRPRRVRDYRRSPYFLDVLDISGYVYNRDMFGKTAVFVHKRNAVDMARKMSVPASMGMRVEVVRMKLGVDLWYGAYGKDEVVLGEEILSIEPLRRKKKEDRDEC